MNTSSPKTGNNSNNLDTGSVTGVKLPVSTKKSTMKVSMYQLLELELEAFGEDISDIQVIVPELWRLRAMFENDFGKVKGNKFTAWTKNRVYFPCVNDGYVWVSSVSRNPDGKVTNHIGF